ncbi:MAG: hypothetical protein JXA64_03305 [Candidatus Fermentibacteraceae bacterium]|nr:hypothetical protein [Candidatus Fermentibacteraceae bacterium]MBN2608119.1 hypothetical protein [Candidatus Fermentibacteraceae bacterium]
MQVIDERSIQSYIEKWKGNLSLSDWDIRPVVVNPPWRKSGDVKIDESNRMAAVMVRSDLDPAFLEQVVVHELLHIKLWGLDQMLEGVLNALFGEDLEHGRRAFAQDQFMDRLETTTQDLARALLSASGFEGEYLFDRVQRQIDEEVGTQPV